jgi:Zn-dependent peptidase ImmA (M78 family)
MKLPRSVFTALGPALIEVSEIADSKESFGIWNSQVRTVTIDGASSYENQLSTLFHEMTHIALWDSGVANFVEEKQAEAVCDAVGTYLAAAVLAGYLKFSVPR